MQVLALPFPRSCSLHGHTGCQSPTYGFAESFGSSVKVECFTSDNQMTAAKWPAALEACDVLVMTPQSLLNMLKAGVVDFNTIDLLVGPYPCHPALVTDDSTLHHQRMTSS